tara:strand:- start:2311 stop:2976 length:666 start_codon:yes stop_codon:yes gene_type:complete
MSITTHSELLTAIANYTEQSNLTAVDDDFVVLAEARLNHGSDDPAFPTPALRIRKMMQRTTATLTGEYLSLPTDFLEMKLLRVTSTARPCRLEPVSVAHMDQILDTSLGGVPRYFAIVGSELRLSPIPTSGTVEFTYYKEIPPLATNDPNFLLQDSPNTYLYGALLEAAIYNDDDADIAKYGRLFAGLVSSLNISGRDAELPSPLYSRLGVSPIRRGGFNS